MIRVPDLCDTGLASIGLGMQHSQLVTTILAPVVTRFVNVQAVLFFLLSQCPQNEGILEEFRSIQARYVAMLDLCFSQPSIQERYPRLSVRPIRPQKFPRTLPSHTEFELSAQDQAEDPPDSLYESMMLTTDPYVPPIIKKVPETITKTLHVTIRYHRVVRGSLQ